MSAKRDIEFLYEMGSLRFVQRTWKRFLNVDFQNLAEHHMMVTWTALLIAKHEKVTNTDRIMKMAIVHDIAESRTGDVDYLSRQYVKRDEELGIKDMLKSTELEKEFLELWEEYEDRKTIEAKIVKDADNLVVDLELREQFTKGLRTDMMFSDYRDQLEKKIFFTKTAEKLAREIKEANPHDWHRLGRNRHNAGDWKDLTK